MARAGAKEDHEVVVEKGKPLVGHASFVPLLLRIGSLQ